jgi:hypothetical protein
VANAIANMVAALKASIGVTTIVGTKVYPNFVPQAQEFPYIVYTASIAPCNSASGPTGDKQLIVHLEMVSKGTPSGYAQCRAMQAAVEIALTGISDGSKWQPQEANDEPGSLLHGQDVLEFQRISQDYTVWYTA